MQCILTLFIVSVLCFALTKAAPGDPVLTYVEPNMSEEYIQNLRESLGLTKPLYEQYFLWLGRIFHGNFGNSLMNNRTVLTQMLERLPATVILMGTSMLLGFLIAIPVRIKTEFWIKSPVFSAMWEFPSPLSGSVSC